MRRGSLLLVLAGCGFHGGGEPPLPDGGAPAKHAFTLAEMQAGQRTDMTVEPWRFDPAQVALTPNAYTYGGLVAHGQAGTKLWTTTDNDWDKLVMLSPPVPPSTSGAGLWTGEEIKSGAGGVRTDYLGPNNSIMTLWLEGEIWLDAPVTESLRVNGDDVAFLDYAQPGSTKFTRLAMNSTGTLQTTTAGWYPIRIGFANGDTSFDFVFTHSDSIGGPQVPWTRDRLRARTSELNGTLRAVFGHQILGGGQSSTPPILHFDENRLAQTGFSPLPQGAGNDDWSARYLGQVYLLQGGSYTLTITSDDGNRGRLGTTRDQTHWGRDDGVGTQPAVKQYVAALAAGWTDLTVDYNQTFGGRSLHVQLAGPDFPTAVEVPRERLRPVEPADDRLAIGIDETNRTVPNGGTAANPATDTMIVAGYANETVSSIELTYQINSQRWGSLKVALEPPNGTPVNLADPGPLSDGRRLLQFTVPVNDTSGTAALLGGPAAGTWKLHVYDITAGGGGSSTLETARLTLHTTGGPDKIARSATWTSVPLDAGGNLIAIDGVTWTEHAPVDASIKVQFRACQQPDCSDDPSWSDPVTSGSGAGVAPRRYLQLRVDMTSNGTLEPELRGLTVAYRHDG